MKPLLLQESITRKRPIEIKFRVSEQEKELIEKHLNETGLNRNEYLVRLITNAAIIPKSELQEINLQLQTQNQQLRGVATNLNQMTKIANTYKSLPSATQLDFMRLDMFSMRSELETLWNKVRGALYGNS